MVKKLLKWLREHYFTIINSIAFYPAIIAIGFLLLSIGLNVFDFSTIGLEFKSSASWLTLKDSSTARTIIATVAAGIISLAVFSFSMVMILLNQAATNMSNRILDSMIGNRFHQVILGFYIGTIVYSFFLLSTIRDNDSTLHIPSISIYVLILLTIVDIFLFIYFLHYITQSVKYETIINRIHENTYRSMKEYYPYEQNEKGRTIPRDTPTGVKIPAYTSGYFHGYAKRALMNFCVDKDGVMVLPHPLGTYLLEGSTIAVWHGKELLTTEELDSIKGILDIFASQNDISKLPYSGCKQLTEVAIKALSPGINDPVTAVLSINALANLLVYRLCHAPEQELKDQDGKVRVVVADHDFVDFFNKCFYPIWDYGKKDRMIQQALLNVLSQMMYHYKDKYDISIVEQLLKEVKAEIK